MKSFLPEFIACICGAALGYGVRLGAKSIRARRAARSAAASGGASAPDASAVERAERRLDLISAIVCIVAVGILCSTTTPKGWEVALLFGYLWPVILHQVLHYPERVIRQQATKAAGAPSGAEDAGAKG